MKTMYLVCIAIWVPHIAIYLGIVQSYHKIISTKEKASISEGHNFGETVDKSLKYIVPHSTDTQSLARDTPYCARSTLDIVVQVR